MSISTNVFHRTLNRSEAPPVRMRAMSIFTSWWVNFMAEFLFEWWEILDPISDSDEWVLKLFTHWTSSHSKLLCYCIIWSSVMFGTLGFLRLYIERADPAETTEVDGERILSFLDIIAHDDPKLRTAWTCVMISTGILWVPFPQILLSSDLYRCNVASHNALIPVSPLYGFRNSQFDFPNSFYCFPWSPLWFWSNTHSLFCGLLHCWTQQSQKSLYTKQPQRCM